MGTAHEFHSGEKMSETSHTLFATGLISWRVASFKFILRRRPLAT